MIYLDNAATTYPKPVSVLHTAEKHCTITEQIPADRVTGFLLKPQSRYSEQGKSARNFSAAKPKTLYLRLTVHTR